MRGESGTVLERKMKIPMTTTETLSRGKGRICGVGIEVRRTQPIGREFPACTHSVCAAGS